MIRKGLLLSLIPLGVMGAFAAWGFLATEPGQQFPVHWGLDGRPDRFGGRLEAFVGLPLVALGTTALLAVLPVLDPRGDNLRRSPQPYLTGWLGALGLLALVQAGLTLTALGVWEAGPDSPMLRMIALGVAVLVAALGNVLGKARPNWFVGVRTPWTLSSDMAWDRTHRVTGRLLVLVGLAGLLAAFLLPPMTAVLVVAGGSIVSAVFSTVFSYLVWRGAPDKRVGPQAAD
jgi:uncharacterized membrane protein